MSCEHLTQQGLIKNGVLHSLAYEHAGVEFGVADIGSVSFVELWKEEAQLCDAATNVTDHADHALVSSHRSVSGRPVLIPEEDPLAHHHFVAVPAQRESAAVQDEILSEAAKFRNFSLPKYCRCKLSI